MKKELLKLIKNWRKWEQYELNHYQQSDNPDYREGVADTLGDCIEHLEEVLAQQNDEPDLKNTVPK